VKTLGGETEVTDMRLVSGFRNPLKHMRAFGSVHARARLEDPSLEPASVEELHEHIGEEEMTNLRLALCGPPEAIKKGLSQDPAPALLVSYVYLNGFESMRKHLHFRDWVMDSGAFTAENSGKPIVLQDYIDCCKQKLASDPLLTEVYSLDVIGDWKGTLANTEEMWKQGVEAIPTFHYGAPEDALMHLAETYPKIALGGMVGQNPKSLEAWVRQCFARVWPKKIHGFGVMATNVLMAVPFHSCDSTSWEQGPAAWGNWKSLGGANPGLRGGSVNLRSEVEWYLDFERKMKHRWKKTLDSLED
jgi:hypothetical protein